MITDRQVRRLMKLMKTKKTVAEASAKAGMDEKTARKYLRLGSVPSEVQVEHAWRTRTDPFEDVWDEVKRMLKLNSGLEAKTLFEYMQRCQPGKFSDGKLRTLHRRLKVLSARLNYLLL